MDARDLRVFEAVARLGGMGRAAEELHTVQSNITARIRCLEQELGTALFERKARGVALTGAGRRLLPYALRIARLLAEARRAALDDGTPAGPLAIGTLETTAALRLLPMLSDFLKAHPAVDIVLRPGTTCELIEQVLQRRLDGAFVCGPVVHPELAAETIFTEELALYTPPGISGMDGLVQTGEARIVVLRRGCSYRQRLEEMLARRGVPTIRVLEFGTLDAVFGCVAAGLGVTLFPEALWPRFGREHGAALHRLPCADAMVQTVFIRPREAHLPSALAAFLGMARSAVAAPRVAAE